MDTIVLSPPHPLQQHPLHNNQVEVHTAQDEDSSNTDKNVRTFPRKLAHSSSSLTQFYRKRKKSLHGSIPPYKTRKFHGQQRRNSGAGPGGGNPTATDWTFFFGGNVHDPLNLNGLDPSDNASTPKTSPIPIPDSKTREVPIPIYVPKDPGDPLKLGVAAGTTESDSDDKVVTSSPDPRSGSRHHYHHHHRQSIDPIVSPVVVVPSPALGQVALQKQESFKSKAKSTLQVPTSVKFRPKDKTFQYGNYNQYYGYRNPGSQSIGPDPRLRALRPEWVLGKDVLDIGCNIGHITLSIARDYGPRRAVGIDIDPKLVKIANKNIKHYVDRDPVDNTVQFPNSLPIVHGRLQPPQTQTEAIGFTPEHPSQTESQTQSTLTSTRRKIPFPYNVLFRQENYVLDSEELLSTVKPQYDLILCLSVTKWVHLNFGDAGLKRFFQRVYLNLRPGGYFILEPQPWSSYKKKKKMTEQTYITFQNISFFPTEFQEYLLGTVGFGTMKQVGIPAHHSKGFQRPIYVFQKKEDQSAVPNKSEIQPSTSIGSSVQSDSLPVSTPTTTLSKAGENEGVSTSEPISCPESKGKGSSEARTLTS